MRKLIKKTVIVGLLGFFFAVSGVSFVNLGFRLPVAQAGDDCKSDETKCGPLCCNSSTQKCVATQSNGSTQYSCESIPTPTPTKKPLGSRIVSGLSTFGSL